MSGYLKLVGKRNLQQGCYHISAGQAAHVTSGEINQTLIDSAWGAGVEFLSNRQWAGRKRQATAGRRRLMRAVEEYLPFIRSSVVYSNQKLKDGLGGACQPCPKFTDYCSSLLRQISVNDAIAESYRP